MNEIIMTYGAVFLAGIMTSLHPCPLSTNAASVSMLIGWSTRRQERGTTLFFFVLGYLFSYSVIAMLINTGAKSIPGISYVLQTMVNYLIGPVLILVGMLMADLLNLNRFHKGRIFKRIRSMSWSGFYAFPFCLD